MVPLNGFVHNARLPSELQRRFEAVVLVGRAARDVDSWAEVLSELRHRGMHVGVVGGPAEDRRYGRARADSGQGELIVADDHGMAWILDELWRHGIGENGVVILDQPTSFGLPEVLADQLHRRRMGEVGDVEPEPGWSIDLESSQVAREPTREALCALADGRLGSSGSPLAAGFGEHRWVIVAGVYDGDGPGTDLLRAPLAFHVPLDMPSGATLRRVLDLRSGVLSEVMTIDDAGYTSIRFASLARPSTLALRVNTREPVAPGPLLLPPSEPCELESGADGEVTWMRVSSGRGGIVAAATEAHAGAGDGASRNCFDRVVVYHSDPQSPPDPAVAVDRLRSAGRVGFDCLLNEHRRTWASRWEDADVVIEGDDALQLATRFALFHLIATAADHDEAAVGARGLYGGAYLGHVFWDADTLVLPFLAATHPASARAMLEYRIRRLPAAMETARAAGRAGARFPWESAGTGFDVTPTSARSPSGELIPIRTGLLEEHIVADVAWAAGCYVDWTGDEEFAAGPGLALLVESARYWAARVHTAPDGSAHIYGVIGPDEYHEPVDDNAFTNVMARWNLCRAAAEMRKRGGAHDVSETELEHWIEIAEAIVDGYDESTGVYEQFDGFRQLEPVIISEVAQRPIAADLVLGVDRVRRAQIVKQADVLMLHHLVPEEVRAGSLEPNLAFYEPRTAHGSSLSPAVHAGLFARVGDFDRALDALRLASRIDLDDVLGQAAGGLHIATMGGVWQALAHGFLGLRPRDGMLHLDPRLPPDWSALEMPVCFRGARLRVRCEPDTLSVQADAPAVIALDGAAFTATSAGLRFERQGSTWKPTA